MVTLSSSDDFLDVSWTMMSKFEIMACSLSFGNSCFALLMKVNEDNFVVINI
jgi:hypothetical protein